MLVHPTCWLSKILIHHRWYLLHVLSFGEEIRIILLVQNQHNTRQYCWRACWCCLGKFEFRVNCFPSSLLFSSLAFITNRIVIICLFLLFRFPKQTTINYLELDQEDESNSRYECSKQNQLKFGNTNAFCHPVAYNVSKPNNNYKQRNHPNTK